MQLQGIIVPITTPFNYDGEVYAAKVEHNVAKWNKTSVTGYVVCGAAGEGLLLTAEEQRRMLELAARYAAPDKLLLCGTGAESVRETVRLIHQAAELGYKAALVGAPHCYRNLLDNAGSQALFFGAVADQARIPLLVDNRPWETGLDIQAETVLRLSAHPNIIGFVEGSGDVEKIARIIREAKPEFQVLTGSARTLAEALAAGAVGAVPDYANAAPYTVIAIWEAHRMREFDAGADWQQRIAPASALVEERYGIPGLKYALDLNGYYGGPVRLPLTSVGPQAKQEIEAAFRDLKG
ncbi:MAG: dihydrodipicolinate synthase family protein [Bryobacteraceae bacterium]